MCADSCEYVRALSIGGLVFLEKDFAKVDAAAHRMVNRAIELEGTCTGEHGVGIGKKVISPHTGPVRSDMLTPDHCVIGLLEEGAGRGYGSANEVDQEHDRPKRNHEPRK